MGIELAEFLAERRREVTVLEEGEIFASQMAHPRRWRVLHDIRKANVQLVSSARVDRITESEVEFTTVTREDKATANSVPADSVIITLGLEPAPDIVARLEENAIHAIPVGDCTGVGYIEGAIREGFHAALSLDTKPHELENDPERSTTGA